MTYMRFDEVEEWKDSIKTTVKKRERAETYDEFKKRKAEKLLETVEIKFPGFRNHIKSYYTATPLTFRHYIGADDGSIYGILKDYNNTTKTFISPRTKIPNLMFTGQNLNLHGVLGVTVSAIVTCGIILGKNELVDKILDANEN
jgi:all-trans-retinol 13,14-reductase